MQLLSEYDFDLPESFIAQSPLEERSASKLFILDRKKKAYIHKHIKDLAEILTENDVLVFNKSRVIPARIQGDFGEIFLSKEIDKNIWQCLVRPGRKFKEGKTLNLPEELEAKVLKVNEDGTRNIEFIPQISECDTQSSCHCEERRMRDEAIQNKQKNSLTLDRVDHSSLAMTNDTFSFLDWLQKYAEIPQPPYIKEKLKNAKRYQTTFSDTGASVAAPTAGLHFTEELLKKLKDKGIETHFVHLNVGLGTFLPVKTKNILDHKMHSESFSLDIKTAEALNKAKKEGKRIIAVGTTSIRVLETCSDEEGILHPQTSETNIFIYPGYQFKFIDAILTNFHTPKSTLLMLISAFAGKENILKAYEEAKRQKYRFYSFGDAMLIT